MKNILVKIVLGLMIVGLVVSCSTNTRQQNTVIGAGTGAVAGGLLGSLATGAGAGWVIAGGAVVGAIVGGLIGHNMDSSDSTHVYNTMSNNQANQSSTWHSHNGASYKMTPTSKPFAYKGYSYCRKFRAVSTMTGKKVVTHGVACRQKDGSWVTVNAHAH